MAYLNIPTHSSNRTNAFALMASAMLLAVPAPLLAQDGGKRDVTSGEQPASLGSTNFHSASELLELSLHTRMGTQQRQPKEMGDLHDFIYDSKSGKLTYAVISEGGLGAAGDTLRIVPWSELIWSTTEDDGMLVEVLMTSDEFMKTPEFKPEESELLTRSAPKKNAVEASSKKGDSKIDSEDGGNQQKNPEKKSNVVHQMSSKLMNLDVFGKDGEVRVGTIDDVIVDADNGAFAFYQVEVGTHDYLVPFGIVEVQPKDETPSDSASKGSAEVEIIATLPMTVEDFKDAPAINDEDRMNATNPKFRRTIAEYYSAKKGADSHDQKEDQKEDQRSDKND